MNKHSRIHLSQKRKEMEEAPTYSTSITNETDLEKSNILQNVSDQKYSKTLESFCKECDIKFSSVKTYNHHRMNYCQKYKTLESLTPIEINKKNSRNQEIITHIAENTSRKIENENYTVHSFERESNNKMLLKANCFNSIQNEINETKQNDSTKDYPIKSNCLINSSISLLINKFNDGIDNINSQDSPLDLSVKRKADEIICFENSLKGKTMPQENSPRLKYQKIVNYSDRIIPKETLIESTKNTIIDVQAQDDRDTSRLLLNFENNSSNKLRNFNDFMNINDNKIENYNSNEEFLNNSLVSKTLSDLYGNKDVIHNNNASLNCLYNTLFFICTTCGIFLSFFLTKIMVYRI
jgi:hypothetical protein